MTTKLDLKYYSPNDAKPVLYAVCFNFLCGGQRSVGFVALLKTMVAVFKCAAKGGWLNC